MLGNTGNTGNTHIQALQAHGSFGKTNFFAMDRGKQGKQLSSG